MSRRAGNVSIKQLSATTNNEGETVITGPSVSGGGVSAADVENVITTMINNDDILDENDVKNIVDNKLTDYTTKTLLNNTLDNYTTKDLLTQSLTDRPTFTVTDALNTTATNHETRITGLENNFVSTTALSETLDDYMTNDYFMQFIQEGLEPYLVNMEEDIEEALDGKANTSHTHTLADITDYVAPSGGSGSSSGTVPTHTHALADITDLP